MYREETDYKHGMFFYFNIMNNSTNDTIRFYFKYVKKYKLYMFLMSVFLLIAVGCQMLWPFVVGQFFEWISTDYSKDLIIGQLYVVLIQLAAVDLFISLGWHYFKLVLNQFESKSVQDITNESFEYLQNHSFRFFNDNFSGALIKRVNRLSSSFQQIVGTMLFEMLPMFLKMTVAVVVLSFINWVLGAALLIWIFIFLTMNVYLAKYKFKYDLARSEADTRVTAELSDTVSNNINLKLFSAFEYEFKRFKKATLSRAEKSRKTWNFGTYTETAQGLLMAGIEILILFFAIKLWYAGSLSVAGLFIIQSYILELFMSIWNFGSRIRRIFEAFADAKEMIVDLNTKHEIRDNKNAKELVVRAGKVEFIDVDFAYEKNTEKVFDKFNLTIKANQKIALVGPSGGGKTTVTKLLLRLFNIKKGQILIDGQNIAKITQESLRSNIALVPQDPFLFHRTLNENIRYGRKGASNEEIIAASKMARCHEFISKMPKGYDTIVGERGIKLSGGQRQRVAIARAILSNAPILVFDEATSSLDSESENLIGEAIENLTKNKTTIIIAHRLSTVMNTDKVFVIDDGEIAEEGNHAELIKKNSGLYQKLWALQSGDYISESPSDFE